MIIIDRFALQVWICRDIKYLWNKIEKKKILMH